jgi:hypothetical protein
MARDAEINRSIFRNKWSAGNPIRKAKLTEQLRLFLPLSPLHFCQSPIPSPNETQSRPRPVFNPVFQQNLPTADVRGNDD